MLNKSLYFYTENDEGSCNCYLTYAKNIKEAAEKISSSHYLSVDESYVKKVSKDIMDENGVANLFDFAKCRKCE